MIYKFFVTNKAIDHVPIVNIMPSRKISVSAPVIKYGITNDARKTCPVATNISLAVFNCESESISKLYSFRAEYQDSLCQTFAFTIYCSKKLAGVVWLISLYFLPTSLLPIFGAFGAGKIRSFMKADGGLKR